MKSPAFLFSLFLALHLVISVFTEAEVSYDNKKKCRVICKDYFETKLDKKMCQPTLNVMPRPGVYHACMSGIIKGFKDSCVQACLHEGKNDKIQPPDSFSACKNEAQNAHPNNQFAWCRNGYDASYYDIFIKMDKMKEGEVDLASDSDAVMEKKNQDDQTLKVATENMYNVVDTITNIEKHKNKMNKYQESFEEKTVENEKKEKIGSEIITFQQSLSQTLRKLRQPEASLEL